MLPAIMLKKGDRVAEFVTNLEPAGGGELPAHYLAYFTCFNSHRYYEAHDVVEHIWLEERGPDRDFLKGLIQFAGAFVHLQKQFERPHHPKDGKRLRPAYRLFHRAIAHLESYPAGHWQLDVPGVCQLAHRCALEIASHHFQVNPWRPAHAPQLALQKS
jgi:predicted metal-dependent hydrolase